MSEAHDPHGHHGPNVQVYLVVGLALAVFTVVSFVVNGAVRSENLTPGAGFAIILGVAVVKAGLVGLYFMHLFYDWGKVGFMIVPAFILGTTLMFVLMPDIVLAWWHP